MPLGTFVNPKSEQKKTNTKRLFSKLKKPRQLRNGKRLKKATGKVAKKLGKKAISGLRNRKTKLEREIARQEKLIKKLRRERDKIAKTKANIDKRDAIREELQDELAKLKKERIQLASLKTQIKNGR